MAQKQFQYETQQYQEDCINNIISIFDGIRQCQPFCDVMTEHHKTHNYHFPVNDTKNIDIMMETGTGKTFTFIKTMFELNKKFGYKKFIILIPTVPIREGTKTNLEDTKEYFKSYYANEREKEIETFVYEGGNIAAVAQYINSEKFSVLILTPSSFNSRDNILNKPLEKEIHLFSDRNEIPPKSYLECLKRLNPIIIMDEPHRFEGDAFKKYFAGFNNYFLRFGATFPKSKKLSDDVLPLSNVAYILDSISSFRQNLVKKIVVYTQDIVQNKDSLVSIDNKKAIVNTLSNGIVVKKELSVGGIYNNKSIKKINKDSIVLADNNIVKMDYSLSDEALRQMISVAIQVHFEKEKALFEQGIKALSLFFIESNIELFRGENPKIKKIFEEEYKQQREETIGKISCDCPYKKYLQNDFDLDGNLQVHKGYFSGDKGSADEKIKAGTDEILKDKKKLLSFESSTRFIFSIWALQEGWDNPNVFTICKLSNQGSEISKLQQIGRGLRICVDQNLKRHTVKEFGDNQESFWQVNNLDVVVSNQELGFVEAIQNEILSNSFFVSDTFAEQDLKKALKGKNNFDDKIVRNLFKLMDEKQMIIFKETVDGQDIFEKSSNYSAILKEQNLPEEQDKALENLFVSDYKNFIQEKSKTKPKKNVVIKQQRLEEFKELWNVINCNAFYIVTNLDNESEKFLISNIKQKIENVQIDEILLQTIRAELNANKIGKEGAITVETWHAASLQQIPTYKSKVDYLEFVQNLSNNTCTSLAFVVKVFNSLSNDFKQKILANNPAQALKEMTEIIRNEIVGFIKTKIHYENIEGEISSNSLLYDDETAYFKAGECGKYQKDISDFSLKEKWIFEDVIEYDSDFEVEIIETDPDNNAIEIFGKLPRLKIKTPFGEYNPDFCYAIKSNKGNKLILIVESKGYETSQQIPANEKAKIGFAKKYFDHLNEYYKEKNVKISFKERINRTQLTTLIQETIYKEENI
ncbi:MAG: DEAD/DEAH box helicase family protein [Prevotellaceae bacterium]|nr:DEAD/DEAH box helicase family protein [Prevotellaceae bacterium]